MTPNSDYLALVTELYKAQPTFDSFFHALSLQYSEQSPTAAHQERVVFANDDSHIMLMHDEREEASIGWFGFFEARTPVAATELWQQAITSARSMGLSTLRGPINGSIWNQYRFITESDESVAPFHGELLCQPWYHQFFAERSSHVHTYYSAMRTNFTALINATAPGYQQLGSQSIVIERVVDITEGLMKEVFELSRDVFTDSWGYVPLTNEELLYLYDTNKQQTIEALYAVRQKQQLVGYALLLRENETLLNLKTIALSPELQGQGIGLALLHRVHVDSADACEAMIYALIADTNKVQRLPQDDATIVRRYAAYDIKL